MNCNKSVKRPIEKNLHEKYSFTFCTHPNPASDTLGSPGARAVREY